MMTQMRLRRFSLFLFGLIPVSAAAQSSFEAPGGVAAQTITNSTITIYNGYPEDKKPPSLPAPQSSSETVSTVTVPAESASIRRPSPHLVDRTTENLDLWHHGFDAAAAKKLSFAIRPAAEDRDSKKMAEVYKRLAGSELTIDDDHPDLVVSVAIDNMQSQSAVDATQTLSADLIVSINWATPQKGASNYILPNAHHAELAGQYKEDAAKDRLFKDLASQSLASASFLEQPE